MAVALAPWSIVLQPGKKETFIPQGDVLIKNAALSDELADESGRTTVKLSYPNLVNMDEDDDESDDESGAEKMTTTVLCSLTPGKVEQASCEIIIDKDLEYTLELVGKNPIYLYGNYIDQQPVDQSPFDSDMESGDEDEDAYDLEEVSSDVEVEIDADEADLDEDASRFEEIEDAEMPDSEPVEKEDKKSLKRPRESDVPVPDEAKLSKSQKKKLAKKMKAESGKAVPPAVQEKPVGEKKEEGKKDKETKKESKAKENEQKASAPEKKGEGRVLEGGVKIRDEKVGSGKMAKKGDKVSLRYIGKLLDGTVFDKNVKGKPFTFTLGAGDVIKGWDIGIAGMQINGEREVTIPPSMGYGKAKMSGIPPNSTLRFEVKLLEIK